MKSKKCWGLTILALTIVMAGCYLVMAGEPSNSPNVTIVKADTREVLVGLKGIDVLVEGLSPEVEKDGFLKNEQIQTVVELELRKYGIKVLSKEESIKELGNPILYVNLSCFINPYSRYSGMIMVSLCENVFLQRQPEKFIIGAKVWLKGKTFQNAEPNHVRDTVKELVDEFINDYLAANPKEQASVKDANDSK